LKVSFPEWRNVLWGDPGRNPTNSEAIVQTQANRQIDTPLPLFSPLDGMDFSLLAFVQLSLAKGVGLRQNNAQFGRRIERHAQSGRLKIQDMSAPAVLRVHEVHVVSGHIDPVEVLREAEPDDGAGGIANFRDPLPLGRIGQAG
jgi:hypothetical protein